MIIETEREKMAYSPVRTNGSPVGDEPQDELGRIQLKMNQTTDDVSKNDKCTRSQLRARCGYLMLRLT